MTILLQERMQYLPTFFDTLAYYLDDFQGIYCEIMKRSFRHIILDSRVKEVFRSLVIITVKTL